MTESLNLGHCDLRFIWNLSFVIWDLAGDISAEKSIIPQKTQFFDTE